MCKKCKYELLKFISISRKKTVLWWVEWGVESNGVEDRNSCVSNNLSCNLSTKAFRRKVGERERMIVTVEGE